GQAADIVLIDADSITMSPMGEPHRQLVHYETGAGVADVFVAGEHVLADGKPTRFDAAAILEEARERAAELSRDSAAALKRAEAMHPSIKAMVKRVHAMECGPCRLARI
ncbi:MAG: hypothetical protein AAF913_13620, partial [Pseudomonadota bacterium]